MNFIDLFFNTKGRLNRKGWWLSSIGLIVILFIFAMILQLTLSIMGVGGLGVQKYSSFIVTLVFVYPVYVLAVKRLNDRSRPIKVILVYVAINLVSALLQFFEVGGSYILQTVFNQQVYGFEPNQLGYAIVIVQMIIAVWLVIELGFLRGQVGTNDHGPDPSA